LVAAYLKALFHHLHGGKKKNHEEPVGLWEENITLNLQIAKHES
jgi:hypothetical protein